MLVSRKGFKPKKSKLSKEGCRTIPDKSLSVIDIMSRYRKGQPLPEAKGGSTPVWVETTHDSPDLEKIRDMDKPEKLQFARDFEAKQKKQVEPELITRSEYERGIEPRFTREDWAKMPKPEKFSKPDKNPEGSA